MNSPASAFRYVSIEEADEVQSRGGRRRQEEAGGGRRRQEEVGGSRRRQEENRRRRQSR